MQISPVVRCVCGKVHIVSPSLFRNVCCPVCGQDLWDLLMGIKK